jgi:hypothetical protein
MILVRQSRVGCSMRPRGRSGKYAGLARDGANVLTHPYYPSRDRTHHIGLFPELC